MMKLPPMKKWKQGAILAFVSLWVGSMAMSLFDGIWPNVPIFLTMVAGIVTGIIMVIYGLDSDK